MSRPVTLNIGERGSVQRHRPAEDRTRALSPDQSRGGATGRRIAIVARRPRFVGVRWCQGFAPASGSAAGIWGYSDAARFGDQDQPGRRAVVLPGDRQAAWRTCDVASGATPPTGR